MITDRGLELHEAMMAMPPRWRARWCEPGPLGCGCMGCANASGQLEQLGFTKDEWCAWVAAHPDLIEREWPTCLTKPRDVKK